MDKAELREFTLKLYALCRQYNIERFDSSVYYDKGQYRCYATRISTLTQPTTDAEDADELIHKMLVDYALDNDNHDMFNELTGRDDDD